MNIENLHFVVELKSELQLESKKKIQINEF